MPDLAAFIERLPKAELHLHIEGTLEPELMFALARRNDIALPYDSVEALRAAYDFGSLQDFLDLYYQGMDVLRREEDFFDLASAYLKVAHGQAVRHAEIFFDPQAHLARGLPLEAVLGGLERARAWARDSLGLGTRLIPCFLRHLDEAAALATLELLLPHRERFAAVGLDSSERGHPPSKFARVFARARAEGLRTVAHAGEEGPADYVRQALDLLQVSRVDHGNRALDDPALVERLARDAVPLTVCPLSNLKLCVVPDLTHHPLREMLDRGLLVTINSDDPAYFGGYVNQNYLAVAESLELDRDQLATIAGNSFRAAFLDADEKAGHLEALNRYLQGA